MAAAAGSRISGKNDLLFKLDSKSTKSAAADKNELALWLESWTVGTTGGSTGFGANGDGNSRVLDTNPYGATTTIWDVSNQDAVSDADGGWNTDSFSIDNTRMYRFSVWVRRKSIGNGSFYLGPQGLNAAGSNVGVLNRSNGVNNTNPYFIDRTWPSLAANTWYLMVGHVWPAGSGTGAAHPDSGIFTTNGTKMVNANDFVWNTTNFRSVHRSYLYYSTDTTTNQQWWNPRVEVVPVPTSNVKTKNTAVPVQKLIKDGFGGRWNLTKSIDQTPGVVSLRKVRRTSSGFAFAQNDSDQSIQIPLVDNFNKLEGTISAWVYPTLYNSSNGIFVNRDNAVSNASDWLWIGLWSSGSLFYFRIGDSAGCCGNDLTFSNASTSIPLNKWTHVTCSWKSGGTAVIYINGVLKASRNISVIPNTSPSAYGRIGLGHESGTTGAWNGQIDQFEIYKTQLTSSQIYNNFNATKSRYL